MVHDVFGLSTPFRSLVRHLDSFNLAGFNDQYFGIEDGGYESIEAMVAAYLALIPRPRAMSPLTVMGWSFGGTVAAAMAAQLDAEGFAVHLILADAAFVNHSSGNGGGEEADQVDVEAFVKKQNHPPSLEQCLIQEARRNLRLIRAWQPPSRKLSDRSKITSIKAMRHPEHPERALTPDDGPLLWDERNGWGERLGGRSWATMKVDVGHFEMFSEPQVGEVARALKGALNNSYS